MNKRESFDHARIDEREWQAQERALQDARSDTPSTDPLAARYRAVAEALRAPPPDMLPPDFAARVAAQVRHGSLDAHFEGTLVRTLTTLLGLSGAATAAVYGQQWLPAILGPLQLDSASAMNWALALGLCVAVSWLTEPLRRMAMRSSASPPVSMR
jgi:hypothetical protein